MRLAIRPSIMPTAEHCTLDRTLRVADMEPEVSTAMTVLPGSLGRLSTAARTADSSASSALLPAMSLISR